MAVLAMALVAAASGGLAMNGPAQSAPVADMSSTEAIESHIRDGMATAGVPGVALALIENGRVALLRTYGQARVGGDPITARTRFQIGSVSKSFTAAAVQALVDDSQLELSAPAIRYFAEDDSRAAADSVLGVTVADLINHTSGFSTHSGNTNQSAISHSPGVIRSAAHQLLERGPELPPGERWQYSNANYQLLGGLVESVSERAFPAVVADKVFASADLVAASYASKRSQTDATGHQYAFGLRLETSTVPGAVIAPQGGVTASIDDLARYLRWQMDRFDAQGWRQHYEAAAIVGGDVRYSHGWFMVPSSNGLIVYHDGNNAGFTAAAAFNADQRTGVVVLANASSGYVGNDVDALTVGVRQMAMSMDVVSERNFGPAIGQLIGLMVLTASVLIWAVAFFCKPQRRAQNWLLIILPSAGLLLLAWLLGAALPQSLGATLDATRVFYPDAGFVLSTAVIACAVWGGVRMIILVLGKRA